MDKQVALAAEAEDKLAYLKNHFAEYRKRFRLIMKKLDVVYLVASIASLTASVLLWFGGSKEAGIYVGLWVPSILGFWNVHRVISKD